MKISVLICSAALLSCIASNAEAKGSNGNKYSDKIILVNGQQYSGQITDGAITSSGKTEKPKGKSKGKSKEKYGKKNGKKSTKKNDTKEIKYVKQNGRPRARGNPVDGNKGNPVDGNQGNPVDGNKGNQGNKNDYTRANNQPDTCVAKACDNDQICRNSVPYVNAESGAVEVSVCGDATYTLDTKIENVCSGHGEKPSGTVCPKRGAMATKQCRADIISWETAKQNNTNAGSCKAPEDAQCMQLKTLTEGQPTWGCVFPSNCNGNNGCLAKDVCADTLQDQDGTCPLQENKYPVQKTANDNENKCLVDTAKCKPVPQTQSFLASESNLKGNGNGASSMIVFSEMVMGLLAVGATAFLMN